MEPEELTDAIARLGRDLGALEGGLECGHHVELAAASDRRAASEVDGPQLHRRPGQGADGGGGVGRIGEQAQPGDHVAHLRPLEEGAWPAEPVGHPPLLEGGGDRPGPAPALRDSDADLLHHHLARGQGRFDVTRDRLGFGALVDARPEADPGGGPGGPARDLGAPLRGRHHGVGCVQQISAVAPGRLQEDFLWAQLPPDPCRGSPARRPPLLVVAGEHRGGGAADERRDQRTLRRGGVLELVDEQVREALGDCVGERGSPTEQPAQLQDRIDVVHRPRRAEHRVMQLVDLRELTLSRRRIALRARGARLFSGPPLEAIRRHAGGLEGVDPVDDSRQQPRRVSSDLVSAQGQLVDSVEQHREALCRTQGLEERIQLGLRRVLAEQAGGRHGMGVDDELLVGALDRLLRPSLDTPRRRH